MSKWDSKHDYTTRTNSIRGTGASGAIFLTASGPNATVFDDCAIDAIVGFSGQDWFFAKTSGKQKDTLAGRRSNELIESLLAV